MSNVDKDKLKDYLSQHIHRLESDALVSMSESLCNDKIISLCQSIIKSINDGDFYTETLINDILTEVLDDKEWDGVIIEGKKYIPLEGLKESILSMIPETAET